MTKKTIKQASDLDVIRMNNQHGFTATDREILARYENVAEAIARAFGSGCEVVIHSLEDMAHSVIKIINGEVTGRLLGSPITDLGLVMLKKSFEMEEDIIGPYFSKTQSGKSLKSVTMLIRNDKNIPIGFLCINFNLSSPLSALMQEFLPSKEVEDQPAENFAPDLNNLVTQAVIDQLDTILPLTGVSPTEKNRRVVFNLEQHGIFDIKGSVELVARELGVTKYTIYKYLREIRGTG